MSSVTPHLNSAATLDPYPFPRVPDGQDRARETEVGLGAQGDSAIEGRIHEFVVAARGGDYQWRGQGGAGGDTGEVQ